MPPENHKPRQNDGGFQHSEPPYGAVQSAFLRFGPAPAIAKRRLPAHTAGMGYLLFKAALSGAIIAIVSEVARRQPGLGALIASLPLISMLGMIWLWRDRPDAANMAHHSTATFWYVLPSLPMFLLIPALLHRGWSFWAALGLGCLLTIVLYLCMIWAADRIGFDL